MHDFGPMLSWLKTTIRNQWCNKMLGTNSTIEDVAAAVQRQPELVQALDDSAAAQTKQRHLHAEISTLTKRRDNQLLTVADTAAIDARLESIGAELRHIEKLRLAATRDVQRYQPNHAEAVRAALSRHRREAAARVVASIAQLAKAAAELDETTKAIQLAGGRPRRLPPIPFIEGIKKIAYMIERES